MKRPPRLFALALLTTAAGCHSPTAHPDHPQLPANVRLIDIEFHSDILHRDIPIRIVAPLNPTASLPVVYLLHGAGEDDRTWTNDSPVAELASHGILLVMPDSAGTYYINDATGHRYEDFFFTELIPAIHHRFPSAATDRAHTAIVGNSRGGYGALVYALKHPQAFSFVAALSPAADLAERHFRWHQPRESFHYRRTFGPIGGPVRTTNDPFTLLANFTPQDAPYFYLTCGDKDTLLASGQRFATHLHQHQLPHEFHLTPGPHGWGTWTPQLPALEASLLTHLGLNPSNPQAPQTP